ncbi:TonB system transport protein ExbD [Novosphingobium aquimarinum]|uniref:TonB system transport protein ExbD n=1 Tax=Novosphingobium aquimarinum TaxID=2682494 RepID=UPI0012EC54FE|nr:TonB system transport protein ExbD [Novosphingobium aquimarinum]
MAFHFTSGDDAELPVNHDINVTPFIDVMLVLLIIFMVAAPLATVDTKVDLPVSNAAPSTKPEQPVFLTVKADGGLLVNEDPVARSGIGPAVEAATGGDREQRVYLSADRTVAYEDLMDAMNGLRSAGYLHVALVGAEGGNR